MDDLDPLLIGKQEPWYMRTPQSVMEISLISLDERHRITDKSKDFFSRTNMPRRRPKNMKNKTKYSATKKVNIRPKLERKLTYLS